MSLDSNAEQRLWSRLREESIGQSQPKKTVRVGHIARTEIPGSLESAKQTVRAWDNRGLVNSFSGGMRAVLTEKGRNTESPDAVVQ